MPEPLLHPDRKEIARYVLARGSEFVKLPDAVERTRLDFDYPDGLGPQPASSAEERDPNEPLPEAKGIVKLGGV